MTYNPSLSSTMDKSSDDEYGTFGYTLTPEQLYELEVLEKNGFPLSVSSTTRSPSLCVPASTITATQPGENTSMAASIPTGSSFRFEGAITAQDFLPSAAEARPQDQTTAVKRRRGRPKGSRNRKTSILVNPASEIKRPVGRPPGSGPRQLAAKANGDVGAGKKRRIGRPPKGHTFGDPDRRKDLSINGLHVRGVLPTGPSHRSAETSTSTSATDSISVSRDAEPEDVLISHDDPSRMLGDDEGSEDSSEDSEDSSANEESLLEEGIGEDDGDEDESGTPSSKVPLRPLPTWLTKAFNAHRNASAPSNRGPDKLPPLYRDHQTFWFPRPATFFVLQNINNLSPQKLYNPRFFLWDPECLVSGGIICPNKGCSAQLQRYCEIPRPRRVVDLSDTFWMIGYRYRCGQCKSPNSVSFRSWDPRILAILPPALAAQFPAHLTYRSGLSLDVLRFMRTCFQHGMGAKQFSNALRVQHLQHYDLLHLQYLQTLAPKSGSLHSAGPFARKFKAFLSFDDKSLDGLHGFVPSSQWLRDVYDSMIEEHQSEFNQHMSMLTGNICAIDHSFKLAKHVAKVDGVPVFTALLTVTNEKGEIRVCNLVATKSHSQFELALRQMRTSLELYGHDQPRVFYTDNMADKEFLEKCFPSLRHDVVPIEKHSHLDPLSIPDHFQISVKRSATAIDDAMRTILELLPDDDTPGSVVIGLDAEWNVETSERGYVTGRGQTAVLQIAHGTRIYILQIGQMLAGNRLPPVLKQVLVNPKILKVGRCVSGDLKYLQQACRSETPFVGGVDIAKLAKDKLLVQTARASLADLCASVLKRRLNKNVSERVSTAWEEEELSREQIEYAALDVHASLAIYNALACISSPQPLSEQTAVVGTPVILFSNDKTRILARGTISLHAHDTTYEGIHITPSRSVIEVKEVFVPGALIFNGTHGASNRRSLDSFGKPPFHLVCLRNHLRYAPSDDLSSIPSSTDQPSVEPGPCTQSQMQSESQGSISPMPTQFSDSSLPSDELVLDTDHGSGFGDLLAQLSTANTVANQNRQSIKSHVPDPASQAEGERVFAGISFSDWVQYIRSGVLKDPFHLFNMFYISAAHGLLHDFAITLRDAIFIWDQADKSRIIAWGQTQNPPESWDDLLFKRAAWLQRRCKRIIPPAEQLLPLVTEVFRTFGPLKDAKSGLPLFNTAAWAVAKNILLLIQKGYLSDPPGIPLYYQVGIDAKTGLPLYRCMRGTNMTEGGVHTHLRSRLPTSGVSIRHVQSCLLDFILRHNLLVGTYNSTGRRYVGHYSIWITNELQETLCLVRHMLENPPEITGWVNGNLYLPTSEVAGVLPIPNEVRSTLNMGSYVPGLHSKQHHHFLASMQGTRKPVLPIHNSEERDLFREFMTGDSGFNDPASGPSWEHAVQLWNNTADTKECVSYKLTEQLKVYYNGDWKKNANIKQTKAMTADVRIPLHKSLRDPRRSLYAPKVPESTQNLHSVTKGFHITSESALGPSSSAIAHAPSQTGPSSNPSSPPPLVASTSSGSTADHSQQHMTITFDLARKRALEAIPEQPKKKRKTRTCRKCAVDECRGRKQVDLCANPCRDCGNRDCRGRNPQRPTKTCRSAWDD